MIITLFLMVKTIVSLKGLLWDHPYRLPWKKKILCHHEEQWLHECPQEFKPLLYRRYVDDTFLVFQKQDHLDAFFNYINSKHQNIKFTMERESDNKISFLDLNVSKCQAENITKLSLSIFRKKTFTGLGMNFHSCTYFKFKINNIKTLIHRAFTLCPT